MDKRVKHPPTPAQLKQLRADLLVELSAGDLSIAEAVRRIRTAAYLTIREYAELAQVNPRYLGDIERGLQNPSVEILNRIGKPMGLTVGFLAERKR